MFLFLCLFENNYYANIITSRVVVTESYFYVYSCIFNDLVGTSSGSAIYVNLAESQLDFMKSCLNRCRTSANGGVYFMGQSITSIMNNFVSGEAYNGCSFYFSSLKKSEVFCISSILSSSTCGDCYITQKNISMSQSNHSNNYASEHTCHSLHEPVSSIASFRYLNYANGNGRRGVAVNFYGTSSTQVYEFCNVVKNSYGTDWGLLHVQISGSLQIKKFIIYQNDKRRTVHVYQGSPSFTSCVSDDNQAGYGISYNANPQMNIIPDICERTPVYLGSYSVIRPSQNRFLVLLLLFE